MLYPQNGARIVTIDYVTSLHPVYQKSQSVGSGIALPISFVVTVTTCTFCSVRDFLWFWEVIQFRCDSWNYKSQYFWVLSGSSISSSYSSYMMYCRWMGDRAVSDSWSPSKTLKTLSFAKTSYFANYKFHLPTSVMVSRYFNLSRRISRSVGKPLSGHLPPDIFPWKSSRKSTPGKHCRGPLVLLKVWV